MGLSDDCFICGRSLEDTFRLFSLNIKKARLLKKWTHSWTASLCNLLQLDESYSSTFEDAKYCLHCQELVYNAEFSLHAISRLQKEVSRLGQEIKSLLHGHYEQIHPNVSHFDENETDFLVVVINTLAVKRQPVEVESETILPVILPETHPTNQLIRKEIVKRMADGSIVSKSGYHSKNQLGKSIPPFSRFGRRIGPMITARKTDPLKQLHLEGDEGTLDYDGCSDDGVSLSEDCRNTDEDGESPLGQRNPKRPKLTVSDVKIDVNWQPLLICNAKECSRKGLSFSKPKEVRQHILSVHGGRDKEYSYHCSKCTLRFKKLDSLRYHMLRTHAAKRPMFPCNICRKLFWTPKSVRSHLRYTHKVKKKSKSLQKCGQCSRAFDTIVEAEAHKVLHMNKNSFDCVLCAEQLNSKEGLIGHVQMCHELKTFVCNQGLCNGRDVIFSSPQEVREHAETVHDGEGSERPYHCSLCWRQFLKRSCLVMHSMKSHGGIPTVPCPVRECSQKFYTWMDRNKHKKEAHWSNLVPENPSMEVGGCSSPDDPEQVTVDTSTKKGLAAEFLTAKPKSEKQSKLDISPIVTKEPEVTYSRAGRRSIKRFTTDESIIDSDEGGNVEHDENDADSDFETKFDLHGEVDEAFETKSSRKKRKNTTKNQKLRKVQVEIGKTSIMDSKLHPTCNYEECREKRFIFLGPQPRKLAVKHLIEVHGGIGVETPIHCSMCEWRCKKMESLHTHFANSHNIGKNPCMGCGKQLALRSKKTHCAICRVDTFQRQTCEICQKTFKSVDELEPHNESHKESKHQFACVICPLIFKNSPDLCYHVQRRHNRKTSKTVRTSRKVRKSTSDRNIRRKYNKHSDVSHKRIFRVVVTPLGPVESLENPLICNHVDCVGNGATFENSSTVRQHMIDIHNEEGEIKPFHCAHCPSQFQRFPLLLSHLESFHNEEAGKTPCPICDKVFLNNIMMQDHLHRFHTLNLETVVKCSICWKRVHTTDLLADHEKLHIEKSLNVCVLCGKQQTDAHALIQHVLVAHEGRHFICNFDECLRNHVTFTSASEMTEHTSSHHTEDDPTAIYHCLSCDNRTRTAYSLEAHRRKKHAPTPTVPCSICGKLFSTMERVQKHIQSYHSILQMMPKCKLCYKSVETAEGVAEHEKLHSTETPFDCVICMKKMVSTGDLRKHVYKMHEVLPFKCLVPGCDDAYDRKTKLEWHRKVVHVNPGKRHKCTHCDYRTRMPSELLDHMAIHTVERKHKCPIGNCTKGFHRERRLKQHMKIVHSIGVVETFPCRICGKLFTTDSGLRRHEIYHSSARPYMCEICSATFKGDRNLRTHQKVHLKTGRTNAKLQRPRKARLPNSLKTQTPEVSNSEPIGDVGNVSRHSEEESNEAEDQTAHKYSQATPDVSFSTIPHAFPNHWFS